MAGYFDGPLCKDVSALTLSTNGNVIWKIELQPGENNKLLQIPEPYKKVIVTEKIKGKMIKFIIDKEIELEAPQTY